MNQSYNHINQIFYKNNKFDDPESIEKLEPYCLSLDLLIDIEPSIINELKEIPIIEPMDPEKMVLKSIIQEKVEHFLPKQFDTIFWSVYVYIYGKDEYDQIGHAYGNRILEEKQKIIEFIKKNPKVLKSSNVKITNGNIEEILSEFMVDKTTSCLGIAALAIYYKMPIFLVNEEKKTYLKFLPEAENYDKQPCYLYLHKSERGIPKYKLLMNNTKPNIESMICLESHLKPFKPVTNYKLEDLNSIADKIGFVLPNKIKKTELYEKLCELCGWSI